MIKSIKIFQPGLPSGWPEEPGYSFLIDDWLFLINKSSIKK